MANLTLNTVVYNGMGIVNALAQWVSRAAGVASGFAYVKARIRFDDPKFVRIKWTANLPTVATADSSCSCTGEMLRFIDADISIRVATQSTTAERTDFALRLKDLVATTDFQSSIINLQQPTG